MAGFNILVDSVCRLWYDVLIGGMAVANREEGPWNWKFSIVGVANGGTEGKIGRETIWRGNKASALYQMANIIRKYEAEGYEAVSITGLPNGGLVAMLNNLNPDKNKGVKIIKIKITPETES